MLALQFIQTINYTITVTIYRWYLSERLFLYKSCYMLIHHKQPPTPLPSVSADAGSYLISQLSLPLSATQHHEWVKNNLTDNTSVLLYAPCIILSQLSKYKINTAHLLNWCNCKISRRNLAGSYFFLNLTDMFMY